jgi:hypothetical protein
MRLRPFKGLEAIIRRAVAGVNFSGRNALPQNRFPLLLALL